MSFTGSENHSISLADASVMTKNYRNTLTASNDMIAHFFGRDAIEAILAQENCVGIRIYYGLNDMGVKQLVVVGVTPNQDDIYTGLLAERSKGCPAMCSSANPLNS